MFLPNTYFIFPGRRFDNYFFQFFKFPTTFYYAGDILFTFLGLYPPVNVLCYLTTLSSSVHYPYHRHNISHLEFCHHSLTGLCSQYCTCFFPLHHTKHNFSYMIFEKHKSDHITILHKLSYYFFSLLDLETYLDIYFQSYVLTFPITHFFSPR